MLFLAILFFNKITAQTYPLYKTPESVYFTDGAYFKDMENHLNRYEGTWRLDLNSNSFIEIKFKKIIEYNLLSSNRKYDFLIGDCQYVLNNSIIINTLSNIDNTYSTHYFMANGIFDTIRGAQNFECPFCLVNEKYIGGYIDDIERPNLPSRLIMRHFTENGVEKIKIWFFISGSIMEDYPFDDFRLPSGQYVLTKID